MSVRGNKRSGMATGLMLAGAVSVLALPSAVLAFSSRFEGPPKRSEVRKDLGTYNSSPQDAQLASASALRSLAQGHPFRFTPAGTPTRPDRSVTVAVRVDPQTARSITVTGSAPAAVAAPTTLHIAPTAFSLGVSRGYQNFAQTLVTPVEIQKIEMPDLTSYRTGQTAKGPSSRFTPRIALDEKTTSGRAPRTFVESEDTVDVGGALRVSRNFNVTAGVRYSQELERLRPVTDGKQDNQAVYVGTQFRF